MGEGQCLVRTEPTAVPYQSVARCGLGADTRGERLLERRAQRHDTVPSATTTTIGTRPADHHARVGKRGHRRLHANVWQLHWRLMKMSYGVAQPTQRGVRSHVGRHEAGNHSTHRLLDVHGTVHDVASCKGSRGDT